jgi:DNA-binding transcriptional LysR family regulator
MELRQLRYFIAVAERLSFSKAAQHLHVTVPPLSRQIHQLEEEFGTPLFVRDRRRVALTDAGRMLLREGRVLLMQVVHVSECVRLAKGGEAGLVRVGIAGGLGERIGRVLIEHAKYFPAVEVQCIDVYSGSQSEALLEGRIDAGFMRPPVDCVHLDSQLLYEERLMVHVCKANPLAKHKSLRVKDLASEPLLMLDRSISSGLHDKILDLYARAGVTPNVIPLPMDLPPRGNIPAIYLTCRKGISIVADEVSVHPSPGSAVVAVPLDEPNAKIGVYLAWRKCEKSMAVLAFLNSARRALGTAQSQPGTRCAARKLGLPNQSSQAEARQ